MTERFRGLMLKASSSAEGKLALRFQHKGTNHWIVPQLSASHQDTVCLQVGTVAGFTVSFLVFTSAEVKHQLRLPMDGETHKRGLASTCVPVTTQSCQQRGWGLHPPVRLLSPSKTRTGWQTLPLGQGLARLTSVPPHFKSALSCPSPGCSVKLLTLC